VSDVVAEPVEVPWRRLSARMLAVHPVREVLRAWYLLLGVLFLGARSDVGGGVAALIGLGVVLFVLTILVNVAARHLVARFDQSLKGAT